MDIRKVKKLIELLEESGIAELEISEGEESVRISRHPRNMPSSPPPQPPLYAIAAPAGAPAAAAPASATSPAGAAARSAASSASGAEPAPRDEEHTITSPMVGTYYASSTPGAKPFVELGMEIKVGQVLCIIEAMKMMNQIESDKAGRITAILAKNGEPVEFGQPLFTIE